MNESFSDEEIVEQVRTGQPELYSEIIRRFEPKLARYVRKFVRDDDELEDVLQEVFVRTYTNLHAFDKDKKFSSWIYRIAHNQALNHLKKNHKESLSLDDHEWHLADERLELTTQTDHTIRKETLELALRKLKDAHRQVLVLLYFEERSYEEVSQILRIPTSTVGTLARRGKIALAKLVRNSRL